MSDSDFPWLPIDDIYDLFGYTNRRSAMRAIREGRFPVPMYKLNSRMWVVDRGVLKKYFQMHHNEGIMRLGGGSGPRAVV